MQYDELVKENARLQAEVEQWKANNMANAWAAGELVKILRTEVSHHKTKRLRATQLAILKSQEMKAYRAEVGNLRDQRDALKAEVERLRERVTPTHKALIGKHAELIRQRDALQAELTKARELLEKSAYRLSDLKQSQISEPIFVFLGATTDRSILCSHCNDKKYVCLDWDGGEWIGCPKCSSVAQANRSAPAAKDGK